MAVTIIRAAATYNELDQVVEVGGQCFAREGVPAAGNIVVVTGDWGQSVSTRSTQSYGAFGARLAAPSDMVGHVVTCEADGVKITVAVGRRRDPQR